jgi:sugar lactone lactonase YvrE
VTAPAPELVAEARCELGEGPVWDEREAALLWVDILRGRLHRLFPKTGISDAVDFGEPLSAVALRAGGGVLLALRSGLRTLAALDGEAAAEPLVEVEADRPGNRTNDGKCDPQGRFWVGTMDASSASGAGALYRVDADLSVTAMVLGTTISNGLGWSPGGECMYFIDSPRQLVWQFDFDPAAGTIANRRDLVSIPAEAGLPDGMAVDCEGGLWVALWGGGVVRRYSAAGALEAEIGFPVPQVSSCAFGGEDLGDLYVTSAALGLAAAELEDFGGSGGVFRVRPGVSGMPTTRFAA